MPVSLRVKLKKLRHKGLISTAEYDDFIAKLDRHDERIRGENMKQLIKTIDILRIQRTCYQRSKFCSHECDTCDLNLPSEDVLKAFNTAIAFLDVEKNKMELLKGEK